METNLKNIARIAIKLFIIYLIFIFIGHFYQTLLTIISAIKNNHLGLLGIFKSTSPFLVTWILYILFLIFIWKKSDLLAEKVNKDIEFSNDGNNLNFEEALNIGVILLGLFVLVDTLPELIRSLTLFFVNYSYFKDFSFTPESNIRQIIHFITQIFKIILGLVLINSNSKITEFFSKNN